MREINRIGTGMATLALARPCSCTVDSRMVAHYGLRANPEDQMAKLVTPDQFVAAIVAVLALKSRKHFRLSDTELDRKFQGAFADLLEAEDRYKLRPNFSFYVDPYHGDSVCLRDTLTAAKEKELIAYNNPTMRTFDVKLTSARAEQYLARSPLPREFLETIVDKHFPA
jgi:hypothetical protein